MFFFKQKTAYEMRISDWSSDVCSSDLGRGGKEKGGLGPALRPLSFDVPFAVEAARDHFAKDLNHLCAYEGRGAIRAASEKSLDAHASYARCLPFLRPGFLKDRGLRQNAVPKSPEDQRQTRVKGIGLARDVGNDSDLHRLAFQGQPTAAYGRRGAIRAASEKSIDAHASYARCLPFLRPGFLKDRGLRQNAVPKSPDDQRQHRVKGIGLDRDVGTDSELDRLAFQGQPLAAFGGSGDEGKVKGALEIAFGPEFRVIVGTTDEEHFLRAQLRPVRSEEHTS